MKIYWVTKCFGYFSRNLTLLASELACHTKVTHNYQNVVWGNKIFISTVLKAFTTIRPQFEQLLFKFLPDVWLFQLNRGKGCKGCQLYLSDTCIISKRSVYFKATWSRADFNRNEANGRPATTCKEENRSDDDSENYPHEHMKLYAI